MLMAKGKNQKMRPVSMGDRVKVKISGMNHQGDGVCRYQDFTVFVPYALEDEEVTLEIIQVKSSYAVGTIIEISKPAAFRVEPPCPVYYECGGCQLQHMSYNQQLKFKQQKVYDALTRIGGLPHVEVQPVLGARNQWNYRNKVQMPMGWHNGELISGFYMHGTHDLVKVDRCLIQHEEINRTIQTARKILKNYNTSVYDEKTNDGFLRHLMVRNSERTQDQMLVLVTNGQCESKWTEALAALKLEMSDLNGIIENVNTKRTNVVLGHESIVHYGEDAIYDYIGSYKFQVSSKSFFQVNPEQVEVLYKTVVDYAEPKRHDTIVDAYCGIGTISMFLAEHAGLVVGIESIPDAIENAIRNSADNGIQNATFVCGQVEDVLPGLIEAYPNISTLVVDPPRAGCDRKVIETIISTDIQKLIYVSCNPASLARDMAILTNSGYAICRIQPVDMFPQTHHIETVVLMSRVEE